MTADLLAALILILSGPAWACIQFQNTRRFHKMNPAQESTFWRPTPEDEVFRIENDNKTLAKAWEAASSRLDAEQVKELEKLPSFRERLDAAVSMSPRRRQPAHHGPMAISASIGGDVSQW